MSRFVEILLIGAAREFLIRCNGPDGYSSESSEYRAAAKIVRGPTQSNGESKP